jgi:ADP-dependent NAD(P)H-hydrate dehydratase / NAD(P)H-hydrate epimerase
MQVSGPILTASEMRAAEDLAMAGDVSVEALMERAGQAVAEAVWRFGGGQPTLILCGPGNNGGDGYVAARRLMERGLDVRVAACSEPMTEVAIAARNRWTGAVEQLEEAQPAPVLVDALFGTGLTRPLDAKIRNPLKRLADSARYILAVDVPSGVGTDDGTDLGGASADVTLALGSLKPAHVLFPAARLCGLTKIQDIGILTSSVMHVLNRPILPAPAAQDHKYRRGLAAVVGGQMIGAGVLAARAAMRIAGYVVAVNLKGLGPDALVHREWSEIASDDRVGALLIGPGLGRDANARKQLDHAMHTVHPLVLDADAIRLLADAELLNLRRRSTPMIMTPHSGEFDALFGNGPGSKIDRARAAAAKSGAVMVLKGADTVIAAPDGRARVSVGAPGWLASAGTGDVLAGLIAGCLANSLAPFEAASAAVWLHTEAARIAGPGLIADDLSAAVPEAIARCQ